MLLMTQGHNYTLSCNPAPTRSFFLVHSCRSCSQSSYFSFCVGWWGRHERNDESKWIWTVQWSKSQKGLMPILSSVQTLFNLYLNWIAQQINNRLHRGRQAGRQHLDKHKSLREKNTQKHGCNQRSIVERLLYYKQSNRQLFSVKAAGLSPNLFKSCLNKAKTTCYWV